MQQFYVGVVEDRDDPLLMGRCRVRVIGIHTESKIDLPTENLPWAMPMTPITSASVSGIGQSPIGPVCGSNVILFFKDASFQYPIMIGTVPGFNIKATNEQEYVSNVTNINSLTPEANPGYADNTNGFKDPAAEYPRFYNEQDSNRLTRRQSLDKTIVPGKIADRMKDLNVANSATGEQWEQPPTVYNAAYPYNHVYETESGHIFEFDDTADKERINLHHRKGTFLEIDNDGNEVHRIVGDRFEVLEKNGYVYIVGNCIVNIDGEAAVLVRGNAHVECHKTLNVNVAKDINVNTNASLSIKARDSINIEAKDIKIKAKTISATVDNIDAKYKQFAAEGMTYFNSGKAQPKDPVMQWINFGGEIGDGVPDPELTEAIIEMEDLDNYEVIARLKEEGYTDDDQIIKDLSAPTTPVANVPTSEIPTSSASTTPVECSAITSPVSNSTQLSTNYKLIDFLKASAQGSVVSQGGLTDKEIVCNLKWVANNVMEPIKAKFPRVIISSGYRRGTGSSQHDKGQAVDMQFSDCSTGADYLQRCKDLLAILPAVDQFIFEQAGGKKWIHISSKSSGNRRQILSYDGSKPYDTGLILYGSSGGSTVPTPAARGVIHIDSWTIPPKWRDGFVGIMIEYQFQWSVILPTDAIISNLTYYAITAGSTTKTFLTSRQVSSTPVTSGKFTDVAWVYQQTTFNGIRIELTYSRPGFDSTTITLNQSVVI